MNCQENAGHNAILHRERIDTDRVIGSLSEQFRIIQGDPHRVAECCNQLERFLSHPPGPRDIEILHSLLPFLTERTGPLVVPLFDLFWKFAADSNDPWSLLQGMLAARDESIVLRSLELVIRCIDEGNLAPDRQVLCFIGEAADLPGAVLGHDECLPLISGIVRRMKFCDWDPSVDPVQFLLLNDPCISVRTLAARILDMSGEPVSIEIARAALGSEACDFFWPYLTYTRATHRDLVCLLPSPRDPPPVLPSLRGAHETAGSPLLRQIIAEAGWQRVNRGIGVHPFVGLVAGDSLPLIFSPAEAVLARECGEFRPWTEGFLFVMEGSTTVQVSDNGRDVDPASRFRAYNVVHAEVLPEFLAVAPLSTDRIHHILGRMDTIVREFIALFSDFTEECSILPSIYSGIRGSILARLAEQQTSDHPSTELTRLTVTFEDPQSLGEVRTLHGLKRYLHQRGLQLGFKLVQRVQATNRTVRLVVTSRHRILRSIGDIRFADFEPDGDDCAAGCRLPMPVELVVNGFSRQLLYGHETYPGVSAFCYGHEVHYFLSFRNHPAFLRINYAPPLQGGMIDLEYYGVSKYELTQHPDFSLHALQCFFRVLGFHVEVEDTRVHARYDKEQTTDLRDLCEKAEAIFCLAPYLLDIDWTIGGLELDAGARRTLAGEWANAFVSWGVLPFHLLLTEDRLGLLTSVEKTPAGRREEKWSGVDPYDDRFRTVDTAFHARLMERAGRLIPGIGSRRKGGIRETFGQLELERTVLRPLRDAVQRGELSVTPAGYERMSPELFQRISTPELFAGLVAGDVSGLESSAAFARLIGPIERFLTFRPQGSVGEFDVQSARLPLQDGDLGIHVLRGPIPLASYSHEPFLFRRRNSTNDRWTSNASFDVSRFRSLLRRANYPTDGIDIVPRDLGDEARAIRRAILESSQPHSRNPVPGERTIVGIRASPGRAVGKVLFGGTGRSPEDFTDAVLVTPTLKPDDGAFLHRAAGVVSTGGGILSHAALLATQYRKPALIVDGKWETEAGGVHKLRFSSTEYRLEGGESSGIPIVSRVNVRESEHLLREGDIVALGADEDLLRVLGQDRDTLSFHEAFTQFCRAGSDLVQAVSDSDILVARGRRIRARHQIEKVLSRISDPVLTCHVVDELLLTTSHIRGHTSSGEMARLLKLVFSNPLVSTVAADHTSWNTDQLRRRYEASCAKALSHIPGSVSIHEILSLRLEALRTGRTLDEVAPCLSDCGYGEIGSDPSKASEVDILSRERLVRLREEAAAELSFSGFQSTDPVCRHHLRRWERTAMLVGASPLESSRIKTFRVRLAEADTVSRKNLTDRIVIWPGEGGLELFPYIGWKASNLAEVERVVGGALVPPWFAVTDYAFRQVLECKPGIMPPESIWSTQTLPTLGEAIEAVLAHSRWDHHQKALQIRNLWESVVLPEPLSREIVAAYWRLDRGESQNGETAGPLVALRSSSHEEDTETAARAGEFDTFLFIRGEQPLLRYLIRTWGGLWSDRALYVRDALGTKQSLTGGGVIIQVMINSRVSGVLQTMNVARNNYREMVINAGWGLGEGIVSGSVGADQAVVSKSEIHEKEPLRFSYVTADKREAVVFNRRGGVGTTRREIPYHQRLRPALEYSELCELVETGARLEGIYGYPLDIEFGIEGHRLWLLQVRPVPMSHFPLQETLENYPLHSPWETIISEHGEF